MDSGEFDESGHHIPLPIKGTEFEPGYDAQLYIERSKKVFI